MTQLPIVQVNYKNVMKQYGLGPNGGILTSLNLFATKFDQVWPCQLRFAHNTVLLLSVFT